MGHLLLENLLKSIILIIFLLFFGPIHPSQDLRQPGWTNIRYTRFRTGLQNWQVARYSQGLTCFRLISNCVSVKSPKHFVINTSKDASVTTNYHMECHRSIPEDDVVLAPRYAASDGVHGWHFNLCRSKEEHLSVLDKVMSWLEEAGQHHQENRWVFMAPEVMHLQ